ncbi:MAG: amidohydrolase family protein [Myxococcota bacterium]|nr:amidohydrolase family protein [Myxococcota bacterium]
MNWKISGGRLWDGETSQTTAQTVDLYVASGEIAGIGAPPGGGPWQEIELPAGSAVMPGLIDAHVHLDLDPTLMAPDAQFVPTRQDRDLRMVARARAMVRAGITTARDLGGGEWRELALRDAIAAGQIPGPRLLCAGQPVTVPKGHCHFWGGVAKDAAAQARVIERQIEQGVDWVKVMATGGVFTKGSAVDRAQFDQHEITAMVTQASAHGRSVAAHCHGVQGIRFAAQAGVRTVEHCSFAGPAGFGSAFDPAAVRELAHSGTWVSPTVNEGWSRRIEKDGRETDFHLRMRAVFGALREAGVPLIASTDAGIPGVHHHRLAYALPAFAHYVGWSPLEVLQSATRDAARALELDDQVGVLKPGAAADLMVVSKDPLKDLSVLESPQLVIAAGRLVHQTFSERSAWVQS